MFDHDSILLCHKAVNASTAFECNCSELKKLYLIKNILAYNNVAKQVNGKCGTFGTGYPFYVLGNNFTGNLPVIDEQIRYNNELVDFINNNHHHSWRCSDCLTTNGELLPDLKQVCKMCNQTDNELKPRKIINRLPDIDMWMVCDTSFITEAKECLILLFEKNNMRPSDIDPIQTMQDMFSITNDISKEIMPSKNLPLDAHIIDYNILFSLIEQVPYVMKKALANNEIPYLAIHPLSYRKKWQYDDKPYNFVHDYLSSLTEFDLKKELKELLQYTRRELVKTFCVEQLYKYLILCGPESVSRRHKTKELKRSFEERVELW